MPSSKSSYSDWKCTPTFKLYHHRFCGLGFHPRTGSTVFRANIQKKGKYYKRNLFEKLEDALQWLIDAIPTYIQEEKHHLEKLLNDSKILGPEKQLEKDIKLCGARLHELEKFLTDAILQQKLYANSPLTQTEIKEAMRLWRQRDFSLAGRVTSQGQGRKSHKRYREKRRRSSSGKKSSKPNKKIVRKLPSHLKFNKLHVKIEQSTNEIDSFCMRCCGAFNPHLSGTDKRFCRSCDRETISQTKADSTQYPSSLSKTDCISGKKSNQLESLELCSFKLLPLDCISSPESNQFDSFNNFFPELPSLSSEEFSPPLEPNSPQNDENNIFDLLVDPLNIDIDNPSQPIKSEWCCKQEQNDLFVAQTPFFLSALDCQKRSEPQEIETPSLALDSMLSSFTGARLTFATTCFILFQQCLFGLLSGNLKEFVQRGRELFQKIAEYIETEENMVINEYYNGNGDGFDMETKQLWEKAKQSAKVFREFEVSGIARRSRRYQLDNPEMYEAWAKGYCRVLNYLEKNARQTLEIITISYQSPGIKQGQKEIAQLMLVPDNLSFQLFSGMEPCGLREMEDVMAEMWKMKYYFNYRRFSRPQIGMFESFGVGPNFVRMERNSMCVFVAETGNWVQLKQTDIIKNVQTFPAFMIAHEMKKYHNPENSYKRFENELYELLYRDLIKL